jgi:hypothetical protein
MAPHLAPTSELALGVAPTTGITLSDEDVRENARSAAVMDGDRVTACLL